GTAQRPAPDPPPLEEFDREHLRLLTDKLSQKANALEAANQRLSMLIELGKELGLDHRPEHLLEHACHAARALLDAESAAIGILDDAGRTFRYDFRSGVGHEAAARLVTPVPHQGFLGEVLGGGRPLRGERLSRALLGV